jgi:anhydro-N-acetylmuramic acid kinase
MRELYIGLMSGTSLDGADAVLVDFGGPQLQVLGYRAQPFPEGLKSDLLALNTPGPDELHRAALAGNAVSRIYAELVNTLLQDAHIQAGEVRAIGAHGQTVRHRPQEFDGTGYTLQLQNPALLAELTAIAVVADFRSRDVAAGGQGAPLVPAFHQGIFGSTTETVMALNIGGISNISILPAHGPVIGFDCGPGNALMDHWCQLHTGHPYDAQGQWAASGSVHPGLLADFLQEPFLQKLPPKSTGRDLFNVRWLDDKLEAHPNIPPADVQATLTEFTARACADSATMHGQGGTRLAVCGGGALNTHLMRRLQALLAPVLIQPSDALGLPVMQVEASAFAWLARQTLQGLTGSLPNVTGAQGARVLGAIYPA